MQLSDLKAFFPSIQIYQDASFLATDVVRSDQNLSSKNIFFAIRGNSFDGHQSIKKCIDAKVSLVVFEDESYASELVNSEINHLLVSNSRQVFEQLMNIVYQNPSRDIYCVGITGTNGKTTTNYCVESVLNQLGEPTAVIGTIDHHLGDFVWPTQLTSPGPEEFYPRLCEMQDKGAKALSVEISSHALDQYRLHSLELDVAIFTNFTQDHLDYHGDMDSYFSAKYKIVSEILAKSSKPKKTFIFNSDEPRLRNITEMPGIDLIKVGEGQASDLRFQMIKQDLSGLRFKLFYKNQEVEFNSSLIGEFNLYNLSFAVAVALTKNYHLEQLVPIINNIKGVRGRLEKVSLKNKDVHCFVDFAHTPDALEKSLQFLMRLSRSSSKPSRILCVFGAGGDRDASKRPEMAKAVEAFADITIVTSDNPRSEDPVKIINEICAGFSEDYRSCVQTELRRDAAIHLAIQLAQKNDIVLVAGKGHEEYQEILGVKHKFSDQDVISNYKE